MEGSQDNRYREAVGVYGAALERLARASGFERVVVHPSALVSMHDESSRAWPKWEEALLKAITRIVRAPSLAPWLEVYAS